MSSKMKFWNALVFWGLAAMPLVGISQSEPVGYVKTVKGSAWVTTSGQRAHAQPDAASVKTPSGIIGVRGTSFMIKVDDVE